LNLLPNPDPEPTPLDQENATEQAGEVAGCGGSSPPLAPNSRPMLTPSCC